jgi:prepilin-type processing-associated H-X9-DG protein
VLADSGLSWAPGGVKIFQNSTYLEPPTGMWVVTPTNHFRHQGRTNALCADAHVGIYSTEGWNLDTTTNLGFVGTGNTPHYEQ